jgi:hypothetical protein
MPDQQKRKITHRSSTAVHRKHRTVCALGRSRRCFSAFGALWGVWRALGPMRTLAFDPASSFALMVRLSVSAGCGSNAILLLSRLAAFRADKKRGDRPTSLMTCSSSVALNSATRQSTISVRKRDQAPAAHPPAKPTLELLMAEGPRCVGLLWLVRARIRLFPPLFDAVLCFSE